MTYKIQRGLFFAFANMSPTIMKTGVASGSGIVVEVEANALALLLMI